MGKTLRYFDSETEVSSEITLTRSEFKRAVQVACDKVLAKHGEAARSIVDSARVAANEATHMDACTWKNHGSCGCPMTYLGYAALDDRSDPDDDGDDTTPADTFAGEYDTQIKRLAVEKGLAVERHGYVMFDSALVTIVEDNAQVAA